MSRRILSILALGVAGSLFLGFLIGMRVQELRAQGANTMGLPPVQAVVYVYLDDRDFFDKSLEYAYARDLAARYEARFLGPPLGRGWPRDLRVTTEPPPCLYGRRCSTTHKWPFQIRSAQHIDPVAARIALGPGDLTMRSIVSRDNSPCTHVPLTYEGAPVGEPYIPQSDAAGSCLHLGPVIRKLARPASVGSMTIAPSASVIFQLYVDDSDWLVAYARTNRSSDIALLVDNWVVGLIHPQVAIDHGLTAPTQGFVFQSGNMSTAMANAIDTAAGAVEPLIQEPS